MTEVARLPLAFLPTPFEYAAQLTESLGGPKIFIKRDDQTGLAFGGNKTRKLEYIIPDLKERGVDTVITTAGLQSNWARQTVAAARKAGMRAVLVLRTAQFGAPPKEYDGNLLLDYMMGADVRVLDAPLDSSMLESNADEPLVAVAEEYRKNGFHPEVLSISSADSPISTIGYVKAAEEIIAQTQALNRDADYVIVTAGLGGSYAGLLAGFKGHGKKTKVIGVDCGAFDKDDIVKSVVESGNGAANLLGMSSDITSDDVIVTSEYTCGGYGKTSMDMINNMKFVAETEALLVDPVYTGKAMMCLVDMIKKGTFKKEDTVVFVHTGGLPALFAYRNEITGGKVPPVLKNSN